MSRKKLQILVIGIVSTVLVITFPTVAPALVFFGFSIFIALTSSRAGIYNLLLASTIAIAWSYFARDQYGYNHDIATLYGINTFPLFAWASGLLINHIFYLNFERLNIFRRIRKVLVARVALFAVFYMTLLLSIETIAYYLFDIHNKTSLEYAGLPICNCLHAPSWMQTYYLVIGPIFFLITLLWDNGDPYNMNKNSMLITPMIEKELAPELADDNSSI